MFVLWFISETTTLNMIEIKPKKQHFIRISFAFSLDRYSFEPEVKRFYFTYNHLFTEFQYITSSHLSTFNKKGKMNITEVTSTKCERNKQKWRAFINMKHGSNEVCNHSKFSWVCLYLNTLRLSPWVRESIVKGIIGSRL